MLFAELQRVSRPGLWDRLGLLAASSAIYFDRSRSPEVLGDDLCSSASDVGVKIGVYNINNLLIIAVDDATNKFVTCRESGQQRQL